MDDGGERLAVAGDRRRRLGRPRTRLDVMTAGVDVALLVRQPVGDLERVVEQRTGESVAQGAWRWRRAKLRRKPGDGPRVRSSRRTTTSTRRRARRERRRGRRTATSTPAVRELGPVRNEKMANAACVTPTTTIGTSTASSERRPAWEARTSRTTHTTTIVTPITDAARSQRSVSDRAKSGSARSRNELSVQLLQQ